MLGLAAKRAEIAAQERAAAAKAAAAAAAGGGGPPPSSFTPGYVPSFGPITPATINGQNVPGAAFGGWPANWGG